MRWTALALFLPSLACAQWTAPPDPSDEDRAAAQQHLERGEALLERERWNAARDELEAAYALAGSDRALLGIARALRALGQNDRAGAAIDLLLETSNDAELRDDARALRASPLDAIGWIVAAGIALIAGAIVIGWAISEATGLQPMSDAVLRL